MFGVFGFVRGSPSLDVVEVEWCVGVGEVDHAEGGASAEGR